jgi:cation diffusion facilitator CzcD-associated flavoprotein CzcO
MGLAGIESTATVDDRNAEHTDTVIVGAGPAGLSIAACLAKAAVPFVLLERAPAIGWSWRNHYERLHLHTVKQHSALPFLPFSNETPKYVPRARLVDYFDAYAEKFALNARLNQNVQSIRRINGQWETRSESDTFISNRVVIASGYNRRPVTPDWPGKSTFQGNLLHSADYRAAVPFKGQKVLVVGFGNTGAEIALDLVENGAQVTLCVRGDVHVVPREFLGTPTQLTGIFLQSLPAPLAHFMSSLFTRFAIGDLSKYGLHKPKLSPFHQITAHGRVPVIDIGTLNLIKKGVIKVVPAIERFGEKTVQFANGADLEFDAVILATGYRPGLDDFLENAQDLVDERGYPRELSVECANNPGLYFLGFINPPAGFLRQIALDAKVMAHDIARKSKTSGLPAHV